MKTKKFTSIIILMIMIFNILLIDCNAMFALANPDDYQYKDKDENMNSYQDEFGQTLENNLIIGPIQDEKLPTLPTLPSLTLRPLLYQRFSKLNIFNTGLSSNFYQAYMKTKNTVEPTSSTTSKLGYLTNYDLKQITKTNNYASNSDNDARWWASVATTGTGLTDFFDKWEDGFIIPGLKDCANGCDEMIPQGLTIAGDYILITEYCTNYDHKSVIIIIEKNTGAYVKTLILNGYWHVGGLTYYDNPSGDDYVFVTGSGLGKKDGLSEFVRIPYNDILQAGDGDTIYHDYTVTNVPLNSCAFITYNEFDNAIYVGDYKDLLALDSPRVLRYGIENGTIKSGTDDLKTFRGGRILAQGCDFLKNDDSKRDWIVYSASGGLLNSVLAVFEINYKSKLMYHAENYLILPPYLEEFVIDEETGKLYCIFESAADSYSGSMTIPIDRICVLNVSDLIDEYSDK